MSSFSILQKEGGHPLEAEGLHDASPITDWGAQELPASPPAMKPLSAMDRHQRNPSAISVPESDISSSGTFIDKGSHEEVPTLANISRVEEEEGPGGGSGALAVADYAPLQPPESAFSSDMSEQHSGRVP